MPGLSNQTFAYTGGSQYYKVPISGDYLLEVWGAQGGYAKGHPGHRTPDNQPISQIPGGKGGYTKGKIRLLADQMLYIFVGGQGSHYTGTSTEVISGGYNGGGSSNGCNTAGGGSGGGGATHISLQNNLLEYCSLNNVLIVSGGGGGSWACMQYSWPNLRGMSIGGHGGQIGGSSGYGFTYGYTSSATNSNIYNQDSNYNEAFNFATGGNQTGGGYQDSKSQNKCCYATASPSKFGKGADSAKSGSHSGGGGGGGLYGGGAGASGQNANGTGGGGGSSYATSLMYEISYLPDINEGHGKAAISPLSISINEFETIVRCRACFSIMNRILFMIFISSE